MSALKKVLIECQSCGHSAELNRYAARYRLKHDLTHDILPALLNSLKCSRCGTRRPRIFDESNRPLPHDIQNTPSEPLQILHCANCGQPIDRYRLADMPGALLCASCEPKPKLGAHAPPYPQPPPRLSKCPRCNYPTIVREHGNDGTYFIGCSSFPKCRWTSPVPANRY